MRRGFRFFSVLVAGVLLAACAANEGNIAGGQAQSGTVVVGAGNFTEQLILGNMYADILEDAGFPVDRSKIGVGAREIYFPAMENGEIDVMAEYLGATYGFLSSRAEGAGEPDVLTEVDELRTAVMQALEAQGTGIVLLESSEAQDQDALAVTQETAERYNLQTVSDLAPVAGELVAGGPPEEETRRTGLRGLEEVYGIVFADFVVTDAGGPVTLEALRQGRIQVGRVFTTTGFIAEENLVILEEDRPLIPGENITPIVRQEALTPEMEEALNAVSAALTTEDLTELNRRVDIDREDPSDVARDFLVQADLLPA
ncbi:MAG: glycine betaine ABC transporter substrate-binding protein [Egibacteraceae bacterium]